MWFNPYDLFVGPHVSGEERGKHAKIVKPPQKRWLSLRGQSDSEVFTYSGEALMSDWIAVISPRSVTIRHAVTHDCALLTKHHIASFWLSNCGKRSRDAKGQHMFPHANPYPCTESKLSRKEFQGEDNLPVVLWSNLLLWSLTLGNILSPPWSRNHQRHYGLFFLPDVELAVGLAESSSTVRPPTPAAMRRLDGPAVNHAVSTLRCFIVYFTLNYTSIYKMNILLYRRRLEIEP